MWDMIVVGGGPAGLTAALYASRAGYRTLVLESAFVGGQAGLTSRIENYPGFSEGIAGADLAVSLSEHAKNHGAKLMNTGAVSLSLAGGVKSAVTKKDEFQAKTVLLCMGAAPRRLEIPGEARFSGSGVSYCATCDGAFFKGKSAAVIGGGDTAAHDAMYLSKLGCEVHLIHRRGELRAVRSVRERLEADSRVTIHWDTVPVEFFGGERLERVQLKNVKTGVYSELPVSAAFVAVGTVPRSELADGVEKDQNGAIITDERMRTNIMGIFAAGDVRNTPLRQIITACSDGAVASSEAIAYINSSEWPKM